MKFILSVDTEGDFWKYIPNPFYNKSLVYRIKWRLNRLRGKFIYAKGDQGLRNIVNYLKENNIKADLNITGHLYLKDCAGFPHYLEDKPKAEWFKKDWYYWDKGGNEKTKPGLYMGTYIQQELKNNPLFNLGLHGFAHECFPLESPEVTVTGIQMGMLAARLRGVCPITYSAPFNVTEVINRNPFVLYDSLAVNGILTTRFAGIDEYPNGYNHEFRVLPPFRKYNQNLILVQASNTFDGTSDEKRINDILIDLALKADSSDKNAIYCLSCHDFTFKNIDKLKKIMNYVKVLEKDGRIEIINSMDLLR
jgi:peptidoglycan/xylan/chitin deacetylase (PgdA/CDA1 family)